MQKKYHRTLEVCCYVAGAGAFGVFIRWLQNQLAFTEKGLAEKSFFHVFVVLYILAMAFVFLRFVDRERNDRRTLPESFWEALASPGKLYTALRWAAGAVVCLGSILLFAASEVDRDVTLLRILAVLGLVFGLSYPWFLGQANRAPVKRRGALCTAALTPVLFYAMWLVVSYKINAINSVIWSYVMEFLAIVVAMTAFFRLAGFCFDSPRSWRCMFFCMMGCALCIMTVADSRYMGMQLMLLGSAGFLLLCCWILFYNLKKGPEKPKVQPDDGFERLGSVYTPPKDVLEEET